VLRLRRQKKHGKWGPTLYTWSCPDRHGAVLLTVLKRIDDRHVVGPVLIEVLPGGHGSCME